MGIRTHDNNLATTGDTMTPSKRFPDEAEKAFSFLKDTGFRLVKREPTRLQFETAQVFVAIEWDLRSGELNALVGLQSPHDEEKDVFTLGDLLALEGVETRQWETPFQVADENKIISFLLKLAEAMQIHARAALSGDRQYFQKLRTFRSARAQAHMLDMTLRRVHSEVEEAWKRRDFAKVADLYQSVEAHLTASEKAKLDYAKKHRGV